MTEFLKTVDIFVKSDANHLEVAFWLANSSMELILACTCFIVSNPVALTHLNIQNLTSLWGRKTTVFSVFPKTGVDIGVY